MALAEGKFKRKRYSLFATTTTLEFTCAVSLEECIERLQKKADAETYTPANVYYKTLQKSLIFQFFPVNGTLCEFYVMRQGYREAEVSAAGSLERWNGVTHVSVEAKSNSAHYLMNAAPWVLFSIICVLTVGYNNLAVLAAGSGLMFFLTNSTLYSNCCHDQAKLLCLIDSTLREHQQVPVPPIPVTPGRGRRYLGEVN